MYIGADKSTNYYKMDKGSHETLLKKNVTKDYKKTNQDRVNNINVKQKEIVTKLDLEERFLATQKKEATITIKDHKDSIKTTPNAD